MSADHAQTAIPAPTGETLEAETPEATPQPVETIETIEPDEPLTDDDFRLVTGCSKSDSKNWRRLPPEHPRHLPHTKNASGAIEYSLLDVSEWLSRPTQHRLRATVLAQFAPPDIQTAFDPARAREQVAQLRNRPQTFPELVSAALAPVSPHVAALRARAPHTPAQEH